MKRILLLLLVCLPFLGVAQKGAPVLPIDKETGRIIYTEVVPVDSATTQQELFSRGREWFAKAYKNSNKVIQLEDKENGKLLGKALMQVYDKTLGISHESGYMNYTIALYMKNGRYKYEITNFHHTGQYSGQSRIPDFGVAEGMINTKKKVMGVSYQKTFNTCLSQMDSNMKDLISELKTHMAKSSANAKQTEW